MFAVGVDVSNDRSTVAVLGARRKVVMKPFEVPHTADGFASLIEKLRGLNGEARIVMEHTGRYYESFAMSMHRAGFFVSAVNPLVIKDYREGVDVRKVKTDRADAMKIAQFALDKWEILPQYTPMDTIRYDLKTLHRQFQLSSKTRTALNNNLIALLEQSYPGVNRYFDSPVRPDGSQKWVDFVDTFWHVDCVASLSRSAFVERYRKWCRRHGYNFSEQKAVELHADARQKFPLVPKSDTCRLLVKEAVAQLRTVSRTVEAYRAEMNRLASQLPEYETVIGYDRRRKIHGAAADRRGRRPAPLRAPEVAGGLCGNRSHQRRFRRQGFRQQAQQQTRLSLPAQDALCRHDHSASASAAGRSRLPVSRQETFRGQEVLRLHDRRNDQIPAHLLRPRSRLPEGERALGTAQAGIGQL